MSRVRLCVAVLGVVAIAAVPAFAANPKDGVYADYKNGGTKLVISLAVDGNKMTPAHYNKCASVPTDYTVKIKDSGRFHFQDTVKDVTNEKIDVNLKGKFKTKNLAVGTVDYDSDGCNANPVDFRAKYQQGTKG
jgi:hypothetical protein